MQAALSNDPWWDSVSSSCPLACWQQQLCRLGVVVCLVLRAQHVHNRAELLSTIC